MAATVSIWEHFGFVNGNDVGRDRTVSGVDDTAAGIPAMVHPVAGIGSRRRLFWGGKRGARRDRARERRHALGGSGAYTRRPLQRRRAA